MLLRALMCQKSFQQLYHLVPLQLWENSLIQRKTEPTLVQSYCWGSSFTSEHFVLVSFCYTVTQLSDSLRPHGLKHTRLSCPSLSPRVCPTSCPLNRWCHPTISSSVSPFSSCPESYPASGSFPVSQLFAPGGQSIGDSASASVLPMNIQAWFPLGLTGLISLLSKGLSRVFSSTTTQKH